MGVCCQTGGLQGLDSEPNPLPFHARPNTTFLQSLDSKPNPLPLHARLNTAFLQSLGWNIGPSLKLESSSVGLSATSHMSLGDLRIQHNRWAGG